MDNLIINYISKYIPLTEEEIEIIKEQNLIRYFKKNELLLEEGEYAKECYFVLSGCVRAYYLMDGEERNTEFYIENQSITPVSYQTKKPSEYYLSCLEDCVLALGSDERNQKLLEKVPKLTTMIMQMSNEMLVQKVIEFDEFKTFSPEQRYLNLLEKRPDLVNRIPLYHLASYLGITQVSLSRIRKRISVQV
ncbi:putative transcriptional regulator, Crp/Fnr family [Emticicia oligotrophica DSM 17448]|uniref:Transcriptional regulator, Crp/Fnr family n=1 Tax=Emticicia oligotrophica (strain DSM 17448 / CIP 109782 / MTCC 6937 / GPTSA100-15) TaxID=929562 RepID=A0ABM5N328_EMTOG|nr:MULTISPECIES: Crp/Fnr family transcriptional regulator [Emticicia]AFK03865.1 putative transcriptional regulator, Crp/Fnr family [Emticicia oligotrophica DSM 17448]